MHVTTQEHRRRRHRRLLHHNDSRTTITTTTVTTIDDKSNSMIDFFSPGDGSKAADISKPDGEPSEETQGDGDDHDYGWRHRRVPLGREGWRVCLVTTCLPVILPWRAIQQHKNITELYPVESTRTEKVGGFSSLPRVCSRD